MPITRRVQAQMWNRLHRPQIQRMRVFPELGAISIRQDRP